MCKFVAEELVRSGARRTDAAVCAPRCNSSFVKLTAQMGQNLHRPEAGKLLTSIDACARRAVLSRIVQGRARPGWRFAPKWSDSGSSRNAGSTALWPNLRIGLQKHLHRFPAHSPEGFRVPLVSARGPDDATWVRRLHRPAHRRRCRRRHRWKFEDLFGEDSSHR